MFGLRYNGIVGLHRIMGEKREKRGETKTKKKKRNKELRE